jgi:transposase
VLPDAVQIADPFHVVKLANTKLDECRRRVQNELLGHRGRKADPLYRVRRLLTKAEERLSDDGREKLLGLLQAGDLDGHVAITWQAKELIRSLYDHQNEELALTFVIRLGRDLKDAAPSSASDRFATTGPGHFFTPENPTDHCSRPSHPAEIRKAVEVADSNPHLGRME